VKSIRCSLLPLMAVLVLPLAASAQQAFEGSVTYRVQALGQAMTMTHHVKGDDVRMDMETMGQSVSVITNMNASRQIMVMHGLRQYMDAAAMQQRMGGMGGMGTGAAAGADAEVDVADLNITATGRKDRIAGHECEYYSFTSSGTQVEVCAAKGLGWYFADGSGGRRGAGQPIPGMSNAQRAQWERKFADGFFPLKISTGNAGEMTMEVTEITRKKLDASMFQLPAGYTEMRIGG
jgi:hypothetical protein